MLVPTEVALELDDRSGARRRERPEPAAALLDGSPDDQPILVPAGRVADVFGGFVDLAAAKVPDLLVVVATVPARVALDVRPELIADPERLEWRGQPRRVDERPGG